MNRVRNWIDAEQVSINVDDDEILAGSGSDNEELEPSSRGSGPEEFGFMAGHNRLVRLEGGSEHSTIERTFALVMERYREEADVVAIHKIMYPGLIGQARMKTFRTFSEALASKCDGNANVRTTWYGGARNEIASVVHHGFSHSHCHSSGGIGVHLSHPMCPIDGAMSREADEDGLRHVLRCTVTLGNMEVVPDDSVQTHPSSDYFDSGVDNHFAPTRFIVWSAFMNSQILPEYMISFKSPSSKGKQFGRELLFLKPCGSTPPSMTASDLLHLLSLFLDPSNMTLINKHCNDFLTGKITRGQLILRVRQIAGDEVMWHMFKLLEDI